MDILKAVHGFAISLLLLATPAAAADSPILPAHVLVAADMRPHLDLDGPWHWSVDPYRDGLSGFHGDQAGQGHRRYDETDVASAMQADPLALYEYDMQRSPTVSLPSSWITHAPEMRYYRGLVWYQRGFTASVLPGKRAFLRFGAVNYTAHIFLNGKRLGEHRGGFTPFAFEVTGLLRNGDNQVTVGVDSERTDDDVPPPVTDWEDYGGITRSVSLVTVPDTYVDDAWIRLDGNGRIAASIRVDGPGAAGMPVRLRIPALGLVLAGTTGADGRFEARIAAPGRLRRWSPESPNLYDIRVEAGADVLEDRIGFRTLAVRGHEILLNGKPVFLRGISLHEEELGADPTRAITPAAARALLTEIKQGLHGNYVRLAHYPHGEVMTRMADELGLIVWSEIPVYWRVNWSRPETLAIARSMLAENILRDRNRASIALWSVGNETPVSDARNLFLARLVADVRALDDSRLVTAALLTRREEANGHVTMVIDDPLVPQLDVMAINTYNGWYSPDPLSAVAAIDWQTGADKPLILSEFGADALAGAHDSTPVLHKFTEEYQAEYYRQTLAMASRISVLRGMSPWILKDFRSPRRQHPLYQQGWNRKGLISETGVRKQAFGVLADWYARKAAVPSLTR
jgi:beta-glucuronidase